MSSQTVIPPVYKDGPFEVTASLLRTPRKSYRLAQIEYVSVQRPLLVFVGLPAIGLIGFALMFWRYLTPWEAWTIILLCGVALVPAIQFGTLRVHSLALRDDELALSFGGVARLRRVRGAVEAAMSAAHSPAGRDDL